MSAVDNAAPLPDLSDDHPSGLNIEFDPEFVELERLSQGKPEQQYGNTIVAAEEPDWKAVEATAVALVDRTYDLRVLTHLAIARLYRQGVGGFAATLDVIRHMLEDRWDSVHPQLDPEDDNDPTLRANAVLALSHPVRVLRVLRTTPLARSERAGSVSWRDIAIANGTIEAPEGTTKLTDAIITAAFRETNPVTLAALRTAVESIVASAAAIPAAFDSNAGHGSGPDFADLSKLAREIAAIMVSHQPVETASPEEEPAEDTAPTTNAAVPNAPPRSAPVFTIATL